MASMSGTASADCPVPHVLANANCARPPAVTGDVGIRGSIRTSGTEHGSRGRLEQPAELPQTRQQMRQDGASCPATSTVSTDVPPRSADPRVGAAVPGDNRSQVSNDGTKVPCGLPPPLERGARLWPVRSAGPASLPSMKGGGVASVPRRASPHPARCGAAEVA